MFVCVCGRKNTQEIIDNNCNNYLFIFSIWTNFQYQNKIIHLFSIPFKITHMHICMYMEELHGEIMKPWHSFKFKSHILLLFINFFHHHFYSGRQHTWLHISSLPQSLHVCVCCVVFLCMVTMNGKWIYCEGGRERKKIHSFSNKEVLKKFIAMNDGESTDEYRNEPNNNKQTKTTEQDWRRRRRRRMMIVMAKTPVQ